MPEPDIDDAILTRQFELRNGGTVDVHVWAPVAVTPNCEHTCTYRITGIGSGKPRKGHGVDDVQAMMLTLEMIAAILYASDAYKSGQLTWLGSRNLGLPIPPGEKPGEDGFEKADLLTTDGQSAIIQIPGDRFAYFAWPGDRLDGLISRLKNISGKMESNDTEAHALLRRTIEGLQSERGYFEAVCEEADIDLAYVKSGATYGQT